MKTLGLNPTVEDSLQLSYGLKKLKVGDLFELPLTEDMEREAVKVDEQVC